MSCINPYSYQYFDRLGIKRSVDLSCGHCLNCMIKKQSALEFLCKKELLTTYRKGQGASFVTLTYDDSHVPYNKKGLVTLRRKDVQLFLKNMRRQMEYHKCKIPFKYIYCGELGDSTARPHYHIIFIGLTDSQVRKYTRKCWKHGLCDVGVLGQGGIRYVLKYMSKSLPEKEVKNLRKELEVENPFVYHSIGIGKEWILENLQKIVEDGFTFNLNGKVSLFPRYILRFVAAHTGISYMPYVKSFIGRQSKDISESTGKSFRQYDYEQSYIKYKTNVACLRSKGKAVTDETLSKAYVRPAHSIDRRPEIKKLSELAYDSMEHKKIGWKNPEEHKPIDARNYDGTINWKKYLDICEIRYTVPF